LFGIAAMAMAVFCTHAQAAHADPIGDTLHSVQSAAGAAPKAPNLLMKATYYFRGNKGVRALDSMGCRAVPMRTLAVDPTVVPKGSVVFIRQTVGLPMPNGGVHDGLWYASDVGGSIKGDRIDLYTGQGPASARAVKALSQQNLSVTRVSTFEGCPPTT
jgi:3D (Asp-Asp-Asp) domain-containing protein